MRFKFKKLSPSKEKNCKKIIEDILENIKSLQLSLRIRRIGTKALRRK